MTDAEASVLKLYSAFNSQDFDLFFDLLAEDINWPHETDGGRLSGRAAVRAYVLKDTAAIQAEYAPIQVQDLGDGRVTVLAQKVIFSAVDGSLWSNKRVRHVFQIHEGLVVRMDPDQNVGPDLDGEIQPLLAALFDALGRQDIEGVMAVFHPHARIPDNFETGDLVGLPAIRAYYLRQFTAIQVAGSITALKPLGDGRFEATVDIMVRGPGGGFWWEGPVLTEYRIEDRLIVGMQVNNSPPAEAR